jgi:hypothetical protein
MRLLISEARRRKPTLAPRRCRAVRAFQSFKAVFALPSTTTTPSPSPIPAHCRLDVTTRREQICSLPPPRCPRACCTARLLHRSPATATAPPHQQQNLSPRCPAAIFAARRNGFSRWQISLGRTGRVQFGRTRRVQFGRTGRVQFSYLSHRSLFRTMQHPGFYFRALLGPHNRRPAHRAPRCRVQWRRPEAPAYHYFLYRYVLFALHPSHTVC